ncbi:MAG: fasciclin domain-containing protein [Paludibacter sp.]
MINEIMAAQNLNSFLDIVDKANYRGTLHAYGAYTLFAPTNEAVNSYLQSLGKSSVADLTEEEAVKIIKYHLVANDTIATSDFVDGRLRARNFMKRYLTTKTQTDGSIVVNRKATILTKALAGANELKGANGFLHIIDAVLTPPDKSITGFIRSLPECGLFYSEIVFREIGSGRLVEYRIRQHLVYFLCSG